MILGELHGCLSVKEAYYETLPEGLNFYFNYKGMLCPVVSINKGTNDTKYKLKLSTKTVIGTKHPKSIWVSGDTIIFVSRTDLSDRPVSSVIPESRRAATPLVTKQLIYYMQALDNPCLSQLFVG